MPSYTISDEDGNTISDVGPNHLLQLLQQDKSAELRREDWPDRAAVARPLGVRWQIEVVDGAQRRVTTTPNVDAALDVMRSWAEDDGWWAEEFSWTPVPADR